MTSLTIGLPPLGRAPQADLIARNGHGRTRRERSFACDGDGEGTGRIDRGTKHVLPFALARSADEPSHASLVRMLSRGRIDRPSSGATAQCERRVELEVQGGVAAENVERVRAREAIP